MKINSAVVFKSSNIPDPKAPNHWAHFWYYTVGVNPLPRVGKIPIIKYKQYQNKRIPQELFDEWIVQGKFNDNLCCMIGRISGHTEILNYARKGLYLNFCDFDNQKAIDEFCTYKGKRFTLEQMSKICYIVQHADKSHCHIYWLASKALPKRTLDKDSKILEKFRNNQLPAIEIKAAGDVAFVPGGKHENGNPYTPVGTNELCIIEELGDHIQSICKKYELPVSDSERNELRRLTIVNGKSKDKQSILLSDDLDNKRWTKIYESSRNNTLFDRARNYLKKNGDILSPKTFKKIVHAWNTKWCKPPLPWLEVNAICNSVLSYHEQRDDNVDVDGGHE